MRRFPLVLAIAALVALGGASPATAVPTKACANTYGGDVIVAHNVGCAKARDLVRTWAVRYKRDGRVNRRVFRFRCRGYNSPYEGLTMTCRRPGGGIVRWYVNVPA